MITVKCIKNIDPWGNRQTDLEVGKEYEVEGISMGGSYTSIYLVEKRYSYNSIMFEFYENGKPLNIYKDRRFNPYL